MPFLWVPLEASAQSEPQLNGYVPPPLFTEPKIPTHEERKSNNIAPHMPVFSPDVSSEETPNEGVSPLIKGRVIKAEDEDSPIQPHVFYPDDGSVSQDPNAENKSEDTVTSAPMPSEKPISAEPKTPEAPKIQQGVVKGPKTMPAVQKKEVDTETTFETPDQKPGEILDRVQEEVQKVKEPEPKSDAMPQVSSPLVISPALSAALTAEADGSRKYVMTYAPLQEKLSPDYIGVLNGLIIPELAKNVQTHVLIQSYASPTEGVLSGDRRISLARALAIRDYLITQSIAQERIDVRSLGNVGDVKPQDRVELYLIN